MKIYSISRIKNEMDIIETFIRYNSNITDGMIILDNNSSDDTRNILDALKGEYPNLHVYDNHFESHHDITLEINYLLDLAVNEYEADMIMPLDADEFITTDGAVNPRDEIQSLDNLDDSYYSYYWKTYLPIYDEFSLENLRYIRDGSLEEHEKVIIPSNLYKSCDIRINPGSHSLSDKDNKPVDKIKLESLRLGHVPIRSKSQCISKIANGWLNNRSRNLFNTKNSWHQKRIFDRIIECNANLSDDDLVEIAVSFSSKAEYDDVDDVIVEDKFNYSFCENMKNKYTPDNINEFSNILKNMEELSYNYSRLSKIHESIMSDIDEACDKYTTRKYVDLLENTILEYKRQNYDNLYRENKKVNELNNRIRQMQEKLTQYQDTIDTKNRQIDEYDEIIKNKNDKLKLYQKTIDNKNNKINAYIKTVEKREKVIENLEEKLKQYN
ncbi:glycosyltransferase family 2 protein [Methanosphaera sp. BMS]|uniref:glycosyltransferase family 2 protein n=1 Tax=Methanosphaera sp. BMS TaxID=1789762 RepID=UPI000DC1F665|nr:glycosyltransferase family 2 protein [Methanosphaera sp. BMS]AWX32218.1 hypothetical protein AW729_03475 [Methanosphaera sp. BMS]